MSVTKLQREANELDLDMHRLVERLRAFAPSIQMSRRGPLLSAAIDLSIARSTVRDHMHPNQRKETA